MTMRPCPACGEDTRDGHVCHKCARETRKLLRQMPWLYARLDETIGRRDHAVTAGAGKGKTDPDKVTAMVAIRRAERIEADAKQRDPVNLSHGGPMPYRPDAAELRDDVKASLVGWVRIACEDYRWSPPSDRIAAICHWLADRTTKLRTHEAANEYAAEIADLHARMLTCINPPSTWRYEAGPCPEADGEGEPCPGTVHAEVPHEGSGAPPLMRCDTCTTQWASWEWARAGRRIEARRQQLARQREYGGRIA